MLNFKILMFLGGLLVATACQTNNDSRNIHFSLQGNSAGNLEDLIDVVAFEDSAYLFFSINSLEPEGRPVHGFVKSDDLISWQDTITINFAGFSPICIFKNPSQKLNGVPENFPFLALCSSSDSNDIVLLNSKDRGRNWLPFAEDIRSDIPFPDMIGADIEWYDSNNQWVLFVNTGNGIWVYNSFDLKNWQFSSVFGEEFPEFQGGTSGLEVAQIPWEDSEETSWFVFFNTRYNVPNGGNGIAYLKGSFDGFEFTPDEGKHRWVDYGSDIRLGDVSYSGNNEKPVFLGVINGPSKEDANRHNFLSMPRRLSVFKDNIDWALRFQPLDVRQYLPFNTFDFKPDMAVSGKLNVKRRFGLPMQIDLTFNMANRKYVDLAKIFGIVIKDENQKIYAGYQSFKRYFFVGDQQMQESGKMNSGEVYFSPCVFGDSEVKFSLIVDKYSVELFGMNGASVLSKQISFSGAPLDISLYTEEGTIDFKEGSITEIN